MIPAAAYYRMSSDQQEASIADQREAVESYARANGYRIVREYADEAISGWKENRKQFQQLIADVPGGEFKAVLCWDQDRFSRFPVLEANYYWHILERAGVQLTTVAQGRLDFTTLAGWLTASIAQHGKSEYCRDLARNTTRGLRKRKLAGDWVGSAPLGYTLSQGRLAIGNDTDVATVRRIFTLRSQGYGFVAICKDLNTAGIPTPRGKRWSQFTVKHILNRDAYLGEVVIGKHSRAKYERLTPGIVRIPNAHPAIISQEEWDACRDVDKRMRKAHTRSGSEGAPLGGLLVCGCCGSPMYPITQDRWKYYVCGNYHQRGECHRCAVPQALANELVIRKVRAALCLDNLAELKMAVERQLAKRQSPAINRAALDRQVSAIDAKIRNATDRLVTVDSSLVAAVEAKLIELHQQRELVVSQISAVPKTKILKVADVLAKLSTIDVAITKGKASEVRLALSQIIQEVRIDFAHWMTSPSGKQRYRPTGGEIIFTKGCLPSGRSASLCKLMKIPKRIRLTRQDLLAA